MAIHTVLQSVETIFKSVPRAKVYGAVAAVFPTVHPILEPIKPILHTVRAGALGVSPARLGGR